MSVREPRAGTELRGLVSGEPISGRTLAAGASRAEHAPISSAVDRQLAAAELLHALSMQLVQAGDVAALYERILDTAVAVMGADCASLQLLEPGGEELVLLGHRGFTSEAAAFWARVTPGSRSACAIALRSGARVVLEDVERCEEMSGSEDLDTLLQAGIRAVQTSPLRSRAGAVIGMLSTHWRAQHAPSAAELRMLDLLARLAADLVDQRRTEAARRDGEARYRALFEDLLETDRRKTDFLAVLSHELRNPLSAIRNGVLLLDRAAPGSDQASRARQVLHRQTDHLARLVDDLLDMARISRGKVRLEPTLIDLAGLARRTAGDQRALFEQAELELRVELPAGPVWVNADEVRLVQVIGNLLHNAAKFTKEGGEVSLRVREDRGTAELAVRDSGAGLTPQELERMWAPFAQADRSLARTKGGLGLGLSLVKALVELHGGTVRANSAGPGCGAEFLVTLPLAGAVPALLPPRGERAAQTSRLVLVIEDNADAGQGLGDLLELRGHRVRVARDGRTGLAAAAEVRPDTVICDLGLPDMSGFDVARALRADGRLRSTRLIALSGYAQHEDRRRAREAGFDAHVAKPPDLEELMSLLSTE